MPRGPRDTRNPYTRGQRPSYMGLGKPSTIEKEDPFKIYIDTGAPETGGLEALARQAAERRSYKLAPGDWTDIANKAYTTGDPSNWWEEQYTKQRPIHYMPGEGGRAADEIRTNYLMAGVPLSIEMADKAAIGQRGMEVSRLMKKIKDVDSEDYQNIIKAFEELKNK